jgi:hypothetical protein
MKEKELIFTLKEKMLHSVGDFFPPFSSILSVAVFYRKKFYFFVARD